MVGRATRFITRVIEDRNSWSNLHHLRSKQARAWKGKNRKEFLLGGFVYAVAV